MKFFIAMFFIVYSYIFFTSDAFGSNTSIDVRSFKSLSLAVTSPQTINKTILITTPVSCDNLLIPSNRSIRVVSSGRITNSGNLTINGHFDAGLFPVFVGRGRVLFKTGTVGVVHTAWFGAKGNGLSDDSNAIQAAIDSFEDVIADGLSKISHQINIDKQTSLNGKFKIQSNFTLGEKKCVFYVSGAKSKLDIEIDFNGNGVTGVLDKSNYSYIRVVGRNMIGKKIATNGIQSIVNSQGKHSIVSIEGNDIFKGTSDNDSVPRLWTTDGGASDCIAKSISGSNINLGWCDSGSHNTAKKIVLDNIFDNGIYIVGKKTNSICEYLEINNSTNIEGFVLEGDGFTLLKVLIIKCSGSSGLQNATNVIIGDYKLINCKAYVPLRSRLGNISSFATIKNISGDIDLVPINAGGGIFQFYIGSVSLNVDTINIIVNYIEGSTKSLFNWKFASFFNLNYLAVNFNDLTDKLIEEDIISFYLPMTLNKSVISTINCNFSTKARIMMYLPTVNLIEINGKRIGTLNVDVKKL